MGNGNLSAGKFNLILSIRHNANATRLNEWQASFERASRLLFDATDGQHQFGTIYVCNNSTGGRNADGWLLEPDGTSMSATDALGNETAHMTLMGDERFKPFVIIHEFGHYGYGLYDEYQELHGPNGSEVCLGGTTANACIMEAGWWDGDRFGNAANGGSLVLGRVSKFCTPSNHESGNDPAKDTEQQAIHGESCWETMEDKYPDLTVPAGAAVAAAPPGADPINWVVLTPEQRFMLGSFTHFRPYFTSVNFGEGIHIIRVEVINKETAIATVMINQDAKLGPRDAVVATPIYQETVEIDSGFWVLQYQPRWSSGRIERLIYNSIGRFIGFCMVGQPDIIDMPEELETTLKDAYVANLKVTPVVDPNTGELLSVEIG